MVKQNAKAKFDETIELAVKLNLDPRQADQQVRGALVLPHGTGVKRTVLVFAKGEKEKEALDAGADFVGGDDLGAFGQLWAVLGQLLVDGVKIGNRVAALAAGDIHHMNQQAASVDMPQEVVA